MSRLQQLVTDISILSFGRVAKLTMRDLFACLAESYQRPDIDRLLPEIMGWIARAQDATGGGGISCHFRGYGDWGPPFVETTGYLIPTMLRYAEVTSDRSFASRAMKSGKWLLKHQNCDGGFPGGLDSGKSIVFNSGQVLFGLMALMHIDSTYLSAAEKTVRWLIQVQEPNGSWVLHTYESRPHSYSTMVAWALSLWTRLTGDYDSAKAARKYSKWMMSQMTRDAFPDGLGLGHRPAYLHFIAYALQGLLMTGELLDDSECIEHAMSAAIRLRTMFEERGKLFGAYTSDWKPAGSYECLTGQMQIARVWQRLYLLYGDDRWKQMADALIRMTASRVSLIGDDGVKGGVAGSFPIWGRYLFYRYPNWSAKFAADALMAHLYGEPRIEWMG